MSFVAPFSSVISKEHNLSASSTRRCRKTARKNVCLLQSFLVKYRVKQLVKLVRFTTFNCCFLINHAFMQQVHSNFNHRCTRTLSVTSLQEPQLSFLNGELHVLHITIMLFKFILNCIKLFKDFWHSLFHRWEFCGTNIFRNTLLFSPSQRTLFCNLLWCSNTSHNVFALCINKVFAVKYILSCRSVA